MEAAGLSPRGHGGTLPHPATGRRPRALAAASPSRGPLPRGLERPLLVLLRPRPAEPLDPRVRGPPRGPPPRLGRGPRPRRRVAEPLAPAPRPPGPPPPRPPPRPPVPPRPGPRPRGPRRPAPPVPRVRLHGGLAPRPLRDRVPLRRVGLRPHPRPPRDPLRPRRELPRRPLPAPRGPRRARPLRGRGRERPRDPPASRGPRLRPLVERGPGPHARRRIRRVRPHRGWDDPPRRARPGSTPEGWRRPRANLP